MRLTLLLIPFCLSFFHRAAQRARMISIKSLLHRLNQGPVLGELDQHRRPCHSLNHHPLHSHGKAQCDDQHSARCLPAST